MSRKITDENFLEWEVYVSGGQPGSVDVARIFFYCLDAPMNPARFVRQVRSHNRVVVRERILRSYRVRPHRPLRARGTLPVPFRRS